MFPIVSTRAGQRFAGNAPIRFNTQSGTSYTLQLSDFNLRQPVWIVCTSSSAITITVPKGMPLGIPVYILPTGAGQITVSGASGITVNKSSALTSRAQYALLGLVRYDSATFLLWGDQT